MVGRNRTRVTLCVGALSACISLGCTNSANETAPPDGSADDTSGPAPGALNWTARSSLTGADFRTIWGRGQSDIFAAGIGDAIAHSGDGGNTWTVVPTGLQQLADGWPKLRHIGGSSADDVWIVGSSSDTETVLLHSADHGQSWQPTPVPGAHQLEAVWPIDAMHVLVADHDGDVFSSSDAGSSWTSSSLGADVALFALWGAGEEGYAAGARGNQGVMFHSVDGGQAWNELNVTPTGPLWNISGTPDGNKVYAAGAGASLAWTFDHGATWTARSQLGSPPAYDLADVWVAPGDGALFFATSKGLVVDVEYKDTGSVSLTYETLPVGDDGSQDLAAVWGRGSGDAWAVGPGGTLRHRQ
jgi:photosystem II stability/assembly factor-like uncharacterized protein